MFNLFRKQPQPPAQPAGSPKPGQSGPRPAPDTAAVPQIETLKGGAFERAEPSTPAEQEIAAQFEDFVHNCRQKFTEPGFDLPTLPSSALKITALLQEPDVSPNSVAQALVYDPVLTAKFLRMANSPMYAGVRKVDSVQVAVQRLGMDMVKSVVLAISLNSTIIREKRLGSHAHELWDHSMCVALASQTLARRLRLDQPSAFTMGIMHDIGKLACWIVLNRITAKAGELRPNLLETLVEDAHAEVGEVLVDVWGMPFEIKLVTGGHHVIQSMADALNFINQRKAGITEAAARDFGQRIGCTILADRALAALGLAREPGDLNIGDSSLAVDLGLTPKDTMEYLAQLPNLLKENKDL